MVFQRFPAELEYKKNPELSKESVMQIQEWVKKQPHLPKVSEEEIILFLSSCYYSSEQAKKTLDLYYTIRSHVPEFFNNRDPLNSFISEQFKVSCAVPMEGLTDSGHKIVYNRLLDSDPSKYDFDATGKIGLMSLDYMLAEEGAHMGLQFVIDLSDLTFGHMSKINIFHIKKMMMYVQEAMPVRLCGFHYIFPVPFMDALLNILRPFMNKHTAELINVHNSLEDLYKHVPKRLLPLEAGGEQPSIKILHENFLKKLTASREWFLEEDKQKVEESLRPGKAKNAGDIFGVEGTFKKLDID